MPHSAAFALTVYNFIQRCKGIRNYAKFMYFPISLCTHFALNWQLLPRIEAMSPRRHLPRQQLVTMCLETCLPRHIPFSCILMLLPPQHPLPLYLRIAMHFKQEALRQTPQLPLPPYLLRRLAMYLNIHKIVMVHRVLSRLRCHRYPFHCCTRAIRSSRHRQIFGFLPRLLLQLSKKFHAFLYMIHKLSTKALIVKNLKIWSWTLKAGCAKVLPGRVALYLSGYICFDSHLRSFAFSKDTALMLLKEFETLCEEPSQMNVDSFWSSLSWKLYPKLKGKNLPPINIKIAVGSFVSLSFRAWLFF